VSDTRDDEARAALRERILRAEEARSVLLELVKRYERACTTALRRFKALPLNAPLANRLAHARDIQQLDAEFAWARAAREHIEGGGRTDDLASRIAARGGLRDLVHPGVILRDGPSGPRPALPDGPDVWEVIEVLQQVEATGQDAIAQVAEWASLTPDEVRLALDYYDEFPEAIDSWIDANRQRADRERGTWRSGRDATG
jgi:hypothetical protein